MAIFGLLWSKKAIFAIRGTKDSILEQKTWSKMEQTLSDYVFRYCPLDENRLQWTGRILRLFLAFMARKRLFLPPTQF